MKTVRLVMEGTLDGGSSDDREIAVLLTDDALERMLSRLESMRETSAPARLAENVFDS